MTDRHSELLQLKNLGMASVNILHAVGINTPDELKEAGSVNAYRRVLSRGINTSKVMLYALEGALTNTHWNDLDPELKLRLVSESEQTLDTVG